MFNFQLFKINHESCYECRFLSLIHLKLRAIKLFSVEITKTKMSNIHDDNDDNAKYMI